VKRIFIAIATCGVIVVAGCGGVAVSSSAASPSPRAVSTAAQLEFAVRAYSAAFLDGHAKAAWMLRSKASQQGESYAQFYVVVKQAQAIYGDATMTSLKVVRLAGRHALVTYRYDVGDIDQVRQPWVLESGRWRVKN